ncbi:MAG: hypothetical protein HYX34_02010 [Actinobacteria bacterium]|nr:hypothetical protein [Actinomycetota bacterium]
MEDVDQKAKAARMRAGRARIGERRPLTGVTATLRTTRPARFGRQKVNDRLVTVENLSVTGAGLVVPADKDDRPSESVELCLAGAWGQGHTVRGLPTPTPGLVYWGIEFHKVQGDFLAAINMLLEAEDFVAQGIAMRD